MNILKFDIVGFMAALWNITSCDPEKLGVIISALPSAAAHLRFGGSSVFQKQRNQPAERLIKSNDIQMMNCWTCQEYLKPRASRNWAYP